MTEPLEGVRETLQRCRWASFGHLLVLNETKSSLNFYYYTFILVIVP